MKIRTLSAAKKRFRATGSGKIMGRKSGRGHLLLQKKSRQKKQANKPMPLSGGNAKTIKALVPTLR